MTKANMDTPEWKVVVTTTSGEHLRLSQCPEREARKMFGMFAYDMERAAWAAAPLSKNKRYNGGKPPTYPVTVKATLHDESKVVIRTDTITSVTIGEVGGDDD